MKSKKTVPMPKAMPSMLPISKPKGGKIKSKDVKSTMKY